MLAGKDKSGGGNPIEKLRRCPSPILRKSCLLVLLACGGEKKSEGLSFKFQYACINRTLDPCELLAAPGGMVDNIRERTKGAMNCR